MPEQPPPIRVNPGEFGFGPGPCDWHGCERESVPRLELDIGVKPVASPGVEAKIENVRLCLEHWREAKRTGRLNLDWERVAAGRARASQ
jgi:hypothetical protein